MTTNFVSVPNTGTTKIATHTFTEDGALKHVERTVPSTSAGDEILMATEAKQDDLIAKVGSLTETAPVSDTASSGLNGRLQRIAQRITSLIALLPTSLATGGGMRVTMQDTTGTAVDYSVPALVEGGTAHDSAMSTRKPVAVGGLAKTALPTAVADGDISHLMLDRMGRVIARAVLEESLGDLTTDVTTGPTNIVAADASNKNRLYGLVLANTNTTNSVKCVVKDDTTTRLTFQIPAGETRGFMVPPDAGMAQAAVNKAWTLTNTGTSPTVTATALFVKAGS